MSIPHALLTLLVIALYLAWTERREIRARLRKDGFTGPIIYSDADADSDAPLLVSAHYQLVGKPDWIIRERWGRLVPLEKKTRLYARKIFPGEVLQLTAYALIIEDITGRSVKLGRLLYTDQCVDVPITDQRRFELAQVLREIRSAVRSTAEQERSHEISGRCAACEFQRRCSESLARVVVDPESVAGNVKILKYR